MVLLEPPGTGKTHLAIALGIRACQAGYRVAFATAAQWVDRLGELHAGGRLQQELKRLGRLPLLIIDEVGYIPFEAEVATLFFQLISVRYERYSVSVTSNKPFGRWGEVFGNATVAAAMIDRLVQWDLWRWHYPSSIHRPHSGRRAVDTIPRSGEHTAIIVTAPEQRP